MRYEKVTFAIERRHFHFFMDEAKYAAAPDAGVVFEENVLSAMIAAEGFHRWLRPLEGRPMVLGSSGLSKTNGQGI